MKFVRVFLLPVVAALLLSGCDTLNAITDQAIERVRDYDDSKTKAAILTPCTAPIGGISRIPDASQRELVLQYTLGICAGIDVPDGIDVGPDRINLPPLDAPIDDPDQ